MASANSATEKQEKSVPLLAPSPFDGLRELCHRETAVHSGVGLVLQLRGSHDDGLRRRQGLEMKMQWRVAGLLLLLIALPWGGLVSGEEAAAEEDEVFPTLKSLQSKEYLKKQAAPVSEELKSAEEAKAFTASAPVTIVGLFEEFEGDDYSRFVIAAESLGSDYLFAHTKDPSHLPGDLKAPAVGLFKNFDEGFVSTKDLALEALTAFLEEESFPLVLEMNWEAAQLPFLLRFWNNSDSKIFFLVDYKLDNIDEYKKIYADLAKANKGKGLRYSIADSGESDSLMSVGVEKDVTPVLIVHDANDQKFIKEKVQASEIGPWVSDYLEGKLKAYMKSELIPESNDEPVKIVVAKTLNETVSKGKFVLLEFYARWCGWCEKLAPTLEEVAVHFKDSPDVLIAKYDATANDVPKGVYDEDVYDVQGFPTVYLHTASVKLLTYDGDRSKDDIIAFIEKHRNPVSASHLESVTKPSSEERYVTSL